MNTTTNVTPTTDIIATDNAALSAVAQEVIATTTEAFVKGPSKKLQAQAIFDSKLTEKAQGLFGSNRDFRSATLSAMEVELAVSRASASTMFNNFKIAAEAAGLATLGRDPKKEKVPTTGKKGRPAGAKNVVKEPTDDVIHADDACSAISESADASTEAFPVTA